MLAPAHVRGRGTVSLRPRVWRREERAELVVEFLELINRLFRRHVVVGRRFKHKASIGRRKL